MRRLLVVWILGAALLSACSSDNGTEPPPPEPDPWRIQRAAEYFGLEPVDSPGNPITAEGVALGRRLFYDTILSDNRSISCASCHRQEFAFSDAGNAFSEGSHGDLGSIHAPAIMNANWGTAFFWDGRAPTLEAQAEQPVPNPIEMNLPWSDAVGRLNAHPEYPALFNAAFGSTLITMERATQAIAQFERTMISMDSDWDKNTRGEGGLSPDAFQGLQLYFDETVGDCFHCHGLGPVFDNSAFPVNGQVFLNNGLDTNPDEGLFARTGNEGDRGKFKVPTLRNVEVTGPYMHDGRFQTLEEVIQFYNTGVQVDSQNLNLKLRGNAQKRIDGDLPVWTQEQMDHLVAFLKALTDSSFLTNPDLSDPFVE